MIGLVKGNKIQHKKSGLVLTVITVTDEGVQCEEKFISTSNCTRWFDLAPVEEVDEPIKPTITEEKSVDDENHEDHTGEANSTVVEGKNSIEEIFYRFSRVLDDHNCYFKQNKEYVAVLSPRKKGTLLQLIRNRQGSVHIDLKKSVWRKLKEQYRHLLEQQYGAKLYDKSRGYIRIFNMEDVNTFTVLLLTALS
jgi:hypothetical protein